MSLHNFHALVRALLPDLDPFEGSETHVATSCDLLMRLSLGDGDDEMLIEIVCMDADPDAGRELLVPLILTYNMARRGGSTALMLTASGCIVLRGWLPLIGLRTDEALARLGSWIEQAHDLNSMCQDLIAVHAAAE